MSMTKIYQLTMEETLSKIAWLTFFEAGIKRTIRET